MKHTKTYYINGIIDGRLIDFFDLTKRQLNKHLKELEEEGIDLERLDYGEDFEETMYDILGGDGVNPVYGAEGVWWLPDGTSRHD